MLAVCNCNAKSSKGDKTPVTTQPTPSPTSPITSVPTSAPVQVIDSSDENETITLPLTPVFVIFESSEDGAAIAIDRNKIQQTTETHIKDYTDLLTKEDPVRATFEDIDITVDIRTRSTRRTLRSLQETGTIAEIGGSFIFDKNGAPNADLVQIFQNKAFADDSFLSSLKSTIDGDGDATVTIASEMPADLNNTKRIGGKNKTGGAVGGTVAAFAAVGVVAFVFMQYKKRKASKSYEAAQSFEAPQVFVETGKGEDGNEHFEAVMSPTFSIEESAKSENMGYVMPQGSRVKSFTSRKSAASVTGAADYDDTYSFDGSTALGQNPNPGDKMLGQVLAMNTYTPASDVTYWKDEGSPGEPKMILVSSNMNSAIGDEESVFTHNNDDGFDSPNILGERSVSRNNMMKESYSAHGRSLSIGDKHNFIAMDNNHSGDKRGDESSSDGIEVAIDGNSEADSESLFGDINPDVLVKPATEPSTLTKTLHFEPSKKMDFTVNIVETEDAQNDKPVLKKTLRPWSNRQVQRMEENHKVTITTVASTPTLVKNHYPTQSAQRALADDSSNDDDSYSSYFSTDNEEDDISKLLHDAKKNANRKGNSQAKPISQNNRVSSNSVKFPIRTPLPLQQQRASPKTPTSAQTWGSSLQQQRASPKTPTSAQTWGSSSTLSATKKKELSETMKSKGISTTNYAAEARKNRMARRATNNDDLRLGEELNKDSISNQVASLRRARLQQRTRM